jgi:CheY-like chemotaxis protein
MRNFQIADSSKILVLEDDLWQRVPFFRQRLPHATIVRNPQIALHALDARKFDMVFLDFNVPDPANLTGLDVARHLVDSGFTGKVVIHSANYWGARSIERILRTNILTVRAEFSTFDINGTEESVIDLGEI